MRTQVTSRCTHVNEAAERAPEARVLDVVVQVNDLCSATTLVRADARRYLHALGLLLPVRGGSVEDVNSEAQVQDEHVPFIEGLVGHRFRRHAHSARAFAVEQTGLVHVTLDLVEAGAHAAGQILDSSSIFEVRQEEVGLGAL